MIVKKLTNLKIFLIFLVTSLLLFLTLIVHFYSNGPTGKTKITIVLKENPNHYLDNAKELRGFPINIFENAKLEYFIENLQYNPKSHQRLIFNIETQYNNKVKCSENFRIVYSKIDNFIKAEKKTFLMQVFGRAKDIDNINSCIYQTVDFINETFDYNYNQALTTYNLNYKKNLIFFNLQEHDRDKEYNLNILNILNLKKLDKNLIEIIYKDEVSTSSDVKVIIFIFFLIFLIISLVIFNKKKYLHFIKKIF